MISRRQFVKGVAATGGLLGLSAVSLSDEETQQLINQAPRLVGKVFDLSIDYQYVNFTGVKRTAISVNNSLPAPTLVFKEGDTVTLRVKNNLAEDTSIHWHGLILPSNMDGVPGLSFSGIKPGETFEYRFTVNQSGTYWYHSHSGYQEQLGVYGAIVIEEKDTPLDEYDREHVVILSDWSDQHPATIFKKLKQQSHYYATQERTLGDLHRDIKNKGVQATYNDRRMWNRMRMSDRDISDVTGSVYTFLMNGNTPAAGWQGLFSNGEKIKLRFINAAAMTFFDVRIPGLKMRVVASDGQAVEPVSVDEFRIGVAETYDVIVEPDSDSAYSIFAQAIDRSGYAWGVLTSDKNLSAPIPELDPMPILSHADMGMAMAGMNHGDTNAPMDMHAHHHMHEHGMANHQMNKMGSGLAGFGSAKAIEHAPTEFGPHVDMRANSPAYKLDDPGIGLREHQTLYGRKVLNYADLKNRFATQDKRQPSREIDLHLTGNMSRYMWSINGVPYSEADAIKLAYGERVRINLINDTMMNHPMHLHGMWSELENGAPDFMPRKHTVIVQPGAKLSYLVTADAKGRWAFHCHLLHHMMGMFREVNVV